MDIRAATLRAGELNHRVSLYAPSGTVNAGSPSTLAMGIAARITPLTIQQRERLAAGGLQGQSVYIITIRYRADVTHDLELVEECCNERTFRILSMIQSERLELLELTCSVTD
jgi:head-tail adaptor